MKIDNCWVIGAGAVGTAIAANLSKSVGRARVTLVGKSPHANKIAGEGLVYAPEGEPEERLKIRVKAPEDMPRLSPGDLLILTGKAASLEETGKRLSRICHPKTGVIALQNGMGPERIVEKALGRRLDRGLVFFGANSPRPGMVRYWPGWIRLRAGPATEAFCDLLNAAGISCETLDDFSKMEWLKLAINCVANPFAGILGINNKTITAPVLDPAKTAILAEVKKTAQAEGIILNTTAEDINRYLNQENTPSLKTDLDRGLPTEIDFINGAVTNIAKKHGIATPANDLVVSFVKFLESTRR